MQTIEETKKEVKPQPTLYGKKTILFPFNAVDLILFIKLHRQDRLGHLGQFCLKQMSEQEAAIYVEAQILTRQIFIWTVMTKEYRTRLAGFVYLSNVMPHSVMISGVMDFQFARGLTKELRRDKYTYSEDAERTLINYCFDLGINRIESSCAESNRRAIALNKKIGFIKEGTMRDAMEIDGRFENIIYQSLLRRDMGYAEQKPVGINTTV